MQAKTEPSCGQYGRHVPWYPQRKWWQPSRLLSQDVGLPPLLEPRESLWMDVEWLQRSLAACSWPGYTPAPLFVPYISGSIHHPDEKISKEQYKWRVSLDVAHFAPSEISLSISGEFLEVGGSHEERPDQHGFISRCFTRKYRLPTQIDVTKIVSSLSVDGILTVEVPVPESSVPAAIIIPIKVETETTGQQQETEETLNTDPDICDAPEAPDNTSADGDGEKSPLEVHGDLAHPGESTAGPQQHEERKEQEEETCEKPAGESHLSEAADGECTESSQDPFENREALESQESPDKDTSKQAEHKEADMNGEIQVMAGSREATGEMAHPEEMDLGESPPSQILSQELQALDIKQEQSA